MMASDGPMMSCDEYISSAVAAVEMAATVGYRQQYQQPVSNATTGNWTTRLFDTGSGSTSIDEKIAAINQVAVSAVSMFGIAGNVLNLLVLTRRQLQRSMDGLERSVRLGLVALAVSDMMFCVFYLLSRLLPIQGKYSPYDGLSGLYFHVYREGLINVFQVTSTWLTVNVALGRYVAICYPLHARGYIRPRGTRIAVGAIIVSSALFNAPRFAKYIVVRTACDRLLTPPLFSMMLGLSRSAVENGTIGYPSMQATMSGDEMTSSIAATSGPVPPPDCECYYYWKDTGSIYQSAAFRSVYSLTCLVVEILLPLLILSVCNVCLIRALRRSYRMQSLYRTNQKPVDSAHRITPTLISLIILFTLFVTPSYLLDFIVRMTSGPSNYRAFNVATTVTNFLLLVNFSVNFVLYLVINVEFRRATRDFLTCREVDHDNMGTSMSTTHQTSVGNANSYRLVGRGTSFSEPGSAAGVQWNRLHHVKRGISETVLSD